jgi:4-aminobutyrate aminotransferase / (S)-3-amino-2-methylpropionate transaminase / 5-aminovalerate transaminase
MTLDQQLPRMRTANPGPKSQAIQARREKNVARGISIGNMACVVRGEGAMVEDVDGNIMLDFAGGIGVLNMGYSNPEVVQAVKDQADKFFHTMIMALNYESYIELAEKMNELVPIDGPAKTIFINSGAEADENAVKIAKTYTKKTDVLCFEGAFHGRTTLTMALTSKIKPYKFGFGPFPPGIHRIPYPYCYRCPYGLEKPSCKFHCASRLEDVLHSVVDPEELACVIIEPVLGEGGFVSAPPEYMIELRKVCDKYNIVMIADEVQSGFCRTGKMFAMNYYPVKPDIITFAKSIAAGLPLSGVSGKAAIMDAPMPGGLGGTYAGNPLSCAAALKVIEIMKRDNYAQKSLDVGAFLVDGLKKMQKKHPIIGDIRALGGMIAIELVKDPVTKAPAKDETGAIVKECMQNGLNILSTGILGNNIRVLCPLVITNDQMTAALDILEKAIAKVTAK